MSSISHCQMQKQQNQKVTTTTQIIHLNIRILSKCQMYVGNSIVLGMALCTQKSAIVISIVFKDFYSHSF